MRITLHTLKPHVRGKGLRLVSSSSSHDSYTCTAQMEKKDEPDLPAPGVRKTAHQQRFDLNETISDSVAQQAEEDSTKNPPESAERSAYGRHLDLNDTVPVSGEQEPLRADEHTAKSPPQAAENGQRRHFDLNESVPSMREEEPIISKQHLSNRPSNAAGHAAVANHNDPKPLPKSNPVGGHFESEGAESSKAAARNAEPRFGMQDEAEASKRRQTSRVDAPEVVDIPTSSDEESDEATENGYGAQSDYGSEGEEEAFLRGFEAAAAGPHWAHEDPAAEPVQPHDPSPPEDRRRASNRFKVPSEQGDSDDPDDCVFLKEVHAPPPAVNGHAAAARGAFPAHEEAGTSAPAFERSSAGERHEVAPPSSSARWATGGPKEHPEAEEGQAAKGRQREESPDVEILEGAQLKKEWEAAKQTKRKHQEERADTGGRATADGTAANVFKRNKTEAPSTTAGPSSPGLGRGAQKFSFSSVVRDRAGAKEGPQDREAGGKKQEAAEGVRKAEKMPFRKRETVADLRAKAQGGANGHAGIGLKTVGGKGPTQFTGLFSNGGAGLRPAIPKGSQPTSYANGWRKRKEPEQRDEGGSGVSFGAALHASPRSVHLRRDLQAGAKEKRTSEERAAEARDQEVPNDADLGTVRADTSGATLATEREAPKADVQEAGKKGLQVEEAAPIATEKQLEKGALEEAEEGRSSDEREEDEEDNRGGSPLGLREKLKQSEEFQSADAAEWEQRQAAIAKQNEEAAALKRALKRKRADQERQLETEQRQKQRLTELRTQQAQEETRLADREQLRGKIRADLEKKSRGAHDMASLLRALGIPVEGGLRPTPQQVNTAYKKALLRFHPDRVNSSAPGEIHKQVEAEETFKVISKLKEKLNNTPKLAPYYGFHSGSSFF